jgi:hypothetical protein
MDERGVIGEYRGLDRVGVGLEVGEMVTSSVGSSMLSPSLAPIGSEESCDRGRRADSFSPDCAVCCKPVLPLSTFMDKVFRGEPRSTWSTGLSVRARSTEGFSRR